MIDLITSFFSYESGNKVWFMLMFIRATEVVMFVK